MKEKIASQLLIEISRKNIDLVVSFSETNPEAIDALMELTLSDDDKLSMRSAWVLEKLSIRHKNILAEYLPSIILRLDNLPTSSLRRLFSKILMLHDIPEDYEGEVLNFCLNMLEAPKEPVAVKANCMTIVFDLIPKYPDLKNEIYAIIEDQIPYHSVGFKSRFSVLKRKVKDN